MMSTKILYRLLLVFTLLLTQLGGMAHGIAHTLAEQSQDQSLPHDKLCDLCAAYAQIGSALASSPVSFTPVEQRAFFALASFTSAQSYSFTAFAARAPPYPA